MCGGRLQAKRRFKQPGQLGFSASRQARRRLGVALFVELFARLRGPRAQPGAPGAFCCGLRLVSGDATTLDVPDSDADNDTFISCRNAR